MKPEIHCLADTRDSLGEGCLWDAVTQSLWWLDIARPSRIHSFNPATLEKQVWNSSVLLTAITRRRDGGFLVAGEDGLYSFDVASGAVSPFAKLPSNFPANRFNDAACDIWGRLWAGTMMQNIGPAGEDLNITADEGKLFRIEADGTSATMLENIGVSNGPCWSPDGKIFYFSDSRKQIIYAFDFDDKEGRISNQRIFNDTKDHGYPDGATVDAEGFVWSARWEGSCVLRIDPKGRISSIVPMPATRPTCICFGGPNLTTAYVTSSRAHVDAASLLRYPQQGGVFAFEPGVTGQLKNEFSG